MNWLPQNADEVLVGFLAYGTLVIVLVWVLRGRARP